MASDNFVDYVKIHCTSGTGGGGSTHFRREKYIPKGGPDGGDGGRGGHVIVKGNKQLWTLLHLKFKKHITIKFPNLLFIYKFMQKFCNIFQGSTMSTFTTALSF